MVIDVLAFRSAMLSISLVSFIVTTFSTTYNTMNDITRAVETCNIDYSIAKRDLNKEDVIQFSSRIRTINIIFVVLLFISLLSVLFKPVNVDKYNLAVSFCPPSWGVVRNDSEDVKQENTRKDCEVSDIEVLKEKAEEMHVFWYFIIVGLMTTASFIMMILLMINVFKLQQLQIRVLKLKTGKAN